MLGQGEDRLRRQRWEAEDALQPGEYILYFIRMGEFVKIGKTTCLGERLKTLQTSSPYELAVLKAVKTADLTLEYRVHAACEALHVRGEWYRLEGGLAKFLGVYV